MYGSGADGGIECGGINGTGCGSAQHPAGPIDGDFGRRLAGEDAGHRCKGVRTKPVVGLLGKTSGTGGGSPTCQCTGTLDVGDQLTQPKENVLIAR